MKSRGKDLQGSLFGSSKLQASHGISFPGECISDSSFHLLMHPFHNHKNKPGNLGNQKVKAFKGSMFGNVELHIISNPKL